jgi:putative acetyltransferase
MKISEYKSGDIKEVNQLIVDVFSASKGKEEGLSIGRLVHNLVTEADTKDVFGFVATEYNQVIGSIFFTRLTFQNGINAFILSPVAIHTNSQGKGVGQKLINFGIETLKENNVALVFTYGDPNYYSKVGFKSISEKIVKAPLKMTQPEGWLCQSLVSNEITPIAGNSYCVEALNNPEYW